QISECAADNGRRSLQNEQPPPTADAEPMHMIQDETGNRSAQDRSDGYADHEERKGTRLFALGKPVREVQNDSREIPGFSQPQHKARNVSCCTVWTKPVSIATSPQVSRIRAIQTRAPIWCSSRLLGISKRK